MGGEKCRQRCKIIFERPSICCDTICMYLTPMIISFIIETQMHMHMAVLSIRSTENYISIDDQLMNFIWCKISLREGIEPTPLREHTADECNLGTRLYQLSYRRIMFSISTRDTYTPNLESLWPTFVETVLEAIILFLTESIRTLSLNRAVVLFVLYSTVTPRCTMTALTRNSVYFYSLQLR